MDNASCFGVMNHRMSEVPKHAKNITIKELETALGGYLIKGLPGEGVFNLHLRGSVGLKLIKGYLGGGEECL